MKKIMLLFVLAAFSFLVNAQPPEGPATVGTIYGAPVNAKNAVSIATLPALLQKTDSLSAKVTAKVLEVCPKKGCWLKLQVDDSTTAFVKMKNYAFFLPLDIKDKTVVIDADVKMKTTEVTELRHYAKDAGKSKEEIALITKPKQEIRLTANGILVVGE